ncbi:hypothetical protein BC832DRAFT_239086 [Gaertneriomyces semiglobifer]|nr:hypothetical protein BC832DRAFT_239086 [Gaertneriomyces semiglobifer]
MSDRRARVEVAGSCLQAGMDRKVRSIHPVDARLRGTSNNQSLRPVTVKQILDAEQAFNDQPFQLDGQELSTITLIGRVMSVQTQSTHVSYVIHDGTQQIDVKKFIDQDDDSFGDENTNSDIFSDGAYVRVIGHIRSFNNKKSIVAFKMRAVESADEISYHNLEAIFVHLYLTKGPLQQQQPPQQQPLGMQAGGQNAYNNYAINAGYDASPYAQSGFNDSKQNDPYAHLPPLHRSIFQYVKQLQHTIEGASLDDITQRLRGQAGPKDIKEAIDQMSNDGMLYSTVSPVHWKPAA